MFGQDPSISEIDVKDLQKLALFVSQHHGVDFREYAMSSFRRRIKRVLDLYKLKSIDELIRLFEKQPSFFDEFVSEITVNVTEMFRDPTFWIALKEHILPNLMLNQEKIKIWHAGCSSGEEVYSMAIMLKELGMLEKVQITATDLDNAIISKAKKGVYPIKNMDVNQRNYEEFGGRWKMSYYYKDDKNEAIMNANLMENVTFLPHDLVTGDVFPKFDLVLCRNVMIYFNQQLQNKVLHKLHESLHKYGYLIIGSKESLIWCDIAHKFIVVNNEEKIYKKIKD